MRPHEQTPPISPARKKPRLSSPQCNPSQELEDALFAPPMLGFAKATAFIPANAKDDPENPFATQPLPSFGRASSILPAGFGFTSASSINCDVNPSYERSPSPQAPPDEDYDGWFKPPALSFQQPCHVSSSIVAPQQPAFVSLGSKSLFTPSATSLAKAQELMKDIWEEDSTNVENVDPSGKPNEQSIKPTPAPAQLTFQRPALQPLGNSFQTPSTPTPAGLSRPAPSEKQPIDQLKMKQKPFRSPLIKRTPASGFANSPLNPKTGFSTTTNVSFLRPSATAAPSTPLRAAVSTLNPSAFRTPAAIPVSTPRSIPTPFITPFKPGMRPGEPGHVKLTESIRKPPQDTRTLFSTQTNPIRQLGTKQYKTFFDLNPPPGRKTFATSGLRPQQFTQEDFEAMDINILELGKITPALAVNYFFHTTSTQPPSQANDSNRLGPAAALKELHDQGCTLATRAWVDNHWGLILWKLAGMVALDPDSESDPATKRWCWTEVKRQLLYRYERELNQAKRPALRLISTQDAPSALPLVLCVSDIFWVEYEVHPGTVFPELEVTDGWYRLKATVDAPMARAVRRGTIRVGRKIGVAGAKLKSERKDPQEILEAYNSVKLILSGNSSHLLPWDAKLGFTKGPCVSTMHSLTPDGGSIAAMDVVVVKTHPLAFLEFFTDTTGRKRKEGPRGEAEEMKINEEWKKKVEREASKIRMDFEKKVSRYEQYVDKLERRAGTHFYRQGDDEPPDHIENLHDQLEEHDDAMVLLNRISPGDAGWLAKHTRRCMELEREQVNEEIEKELQATCPPRDVRSFRVVIAQDSRTCRRPANRYAQLTVWDASNLILSEGARPGAIEVGSRFLVTNLIPQQQGAWMSNKPNSQIFLATTRTTKWHKLKPSD